MRRRSSSVHCSANGYVVVSRPEGGRTFEGGREWLWSFFACTGKLSTCWAFVRVAFDLSRYHRSRLQRIVISCGNGGKVSRTSLMMCYEWESEMEIVSGTRASGG